MVATERTADAVSWKSEMLATSKAILEDSVDRSRAVVNQFLDAVRSAQPRVQEFLKAQTDRAQAVADEVLSQILSSCRSVHCSRCNVFCVLCGVESPGAALIPAVSLVRAQEVQCISGVGRLLEIPRRGPRS